MYRIFWFLVVLGTQSDAISSYCTQKTRSMANLDLVEESLKMAKDLYPDCDDVRTALVCGGTTMTVDCGWGSIIQFITANYGRTELAPCYEGDHWPLDCVYPESNATTRRLCDGKRSCTVHATVAQFGRDPCYGTPKYLKMDYRCVPENGNENFTECSKKDKSLAFIDVALNLVSDAKKNFPKCPNVHLKDCQDVKASGGHKSGVYTVWPGGKAVRVRCDMDTEGGGWTVIQRRGNFSHQEDFNRNWQDYKNGFGNLFQDFWIGNDNIYSLTNQGNYSLRIDMAAADGNSVYELFQEFSIGDENSNYVLHVAEPSGTAGDSMTVNNGMMFTTKDRKNDKWRNGNCAELRKGGFWYNHCGACSPNGLYNPGHSGDSNTDTMHYETFRKFVGLVSMEMKLKRL